MQLVVLKDIAINNETKDKLLPKLEKKVLIFNGNVQRGDFIFTDPVDNTVVWREGHGNSIVINTTYVNIKTADNVYAFAVVGHTLNHKG